MGSSIREKHVANGVPDFRNLGVILRVVLVTNALGAAAMVVAIADPRAWLVGFVDLAPRLQPPLLVAVGLLAALRDLLYRLARWPARLLIVAIVVGVVLLAEAFWRAAGLAPGEPLRAVLLAIFVCVQLLLYFALRAAASDPAANAARVAALTARIRPHFLFNSLNAVLSLIRSDPLRAERALENLADLFRVLMREPKDLTPLSDEIELCRQYLELEKLRIGDRLRVEWDIADVPGDARVPPLMLQPLLENAVYHGIEPAPGGGVVRIAFSRRGKSLLIELSNPVVGTSTAGSGQHMALANIRERLALRYDLEARLETREDGGIYRVRIELPYREEV